MLAANAQLVLSKFAFSFRIEMNDSNSINEQAMSSSSSTDRLVDSVRQTMSSSSSTDRLVDFLASINFVFTLGCLYLLILIYKHLENRDEELDCCEANENDEIEDEQVSNLSDKQIDEIEDEQVSNLSNKQIDENESSLIEDEENSNLSNKQIDENESSLIEDEENSNLANSSNLKASSSEEVSVDECFGLISEEELEHRLEYVNERLKLDSEWLLKRSSMLFGAWATDYTRSLNELNSKYKN